MADAATALAHGEERAAEAAQTADKTFKEGLSGESLPSFAVASGEVTIMEALIGLGFVTSKGEARRKIAEGAVRADGTVITDPDHILHFGPTPRKISLGKKKHGLLVR